MRMIPWKALRRAALIASVALGSAALTGCYEHGYNSFSVYGSSGYRDGYHNRSYGNPYWGWRNNYYYPGVGVYVYDRDRRAHRWNDDQRRYWEGRWNGWNGDRRSRRGEWRDFDGRGGDGDRNRNWDGDRDRNRDWDGDRDRNRDWDGDGGRNRDRDGGRNRDRDRNRDWDGRR